MAAVLAMLRSIWTIAVNVPLCHVAGTCKPCWACQRMPFFALQYTEPSCPSTLAHIGNYVARKSHVDVWIAPNM